MAFATITTVAGAEKVNCQPGQSMECAFTVTSESAHAVRVSLQALAEGTTKKEWLELVGERERDLPGSGSEHVTVRISVPADAQPGRYSFRLRAYATDDPEQTTESPAVAAEVSAAAKPPPPPPPPKGGFPWWIVVVAVLVIGGAVTAWLLWPSEVEVPELTSKTIQEAEEEIEKAGLKVGAIEEKATRTHRTDRVIDQKPPAGESVSKGTAVDLTVAVRPDVDPEAEKKKACNRYTDSAIAQNKQNIQKKCGFTGPRWTSVRANHFNWCMGGERYRTNAPQETKARTAALNRCGRPTGTLQGSWKNKDANTRSITRLEIKTRGNRLEVHAWGSCTPQDCDWGVAKGTVTGSKGKVKWDQGFVERTMTLTLKGKVLTVVTDSIYKDKRPRRKSTEHFVRK